MLLAVGITVGCGRPGLLRAAGSKEGDLMARIALFTDEPVLATGFTSTLASAPGLELISVAQDPECFVTVLQQARPDIAVIDMVPEITFSLLAQIHREAPECNLVLWTRAISMELAYQVMELGVRGILKKTLPPELVIKCLTKVAAGELWFDKSLTAGFLTARTVTLTNRESQLVMLLAQGLKNKEIAHALNLSEGTVKVYLSRLFQKIGVKDRFELALYGLRNLQNLQALGVVPAESLLAPVAGRSRPPHYQPLRTLVLERPAAMRKPVALKPNAGTALAAGNRTV